MLRKPAIIFHDQGKIFTSERARQVLMDRLGIITEQAPPYAASEHLMFIKELTDQGRLQHDHPLGLCLVAAGRGTTIPLKETLDLPDPTWLQFRRRLDKLDPFYRIAGHTSEEVREILATLETVYQPLFPQLNLRQWSGSIYTWLTQPVLDPTNSGRVTMDYLMKLVTTALEWSYETQTTDVKAEM